MGLVAWIFGLDSVVDRKSWWMQRSSIRLLFHSEDWTFARLFLSGFFFPGPGVWWTWPCYILVILETILILVVF